MSAGYIFVLINFVSGKWVRTCEWEVEGEIGSERWNSVEVGREVKMESYVNWKIYGGSLKQSGSRKESGS
jgi:hypothetical protein